MDGPHAALRLPGYDGSVTQALWDRLPATPEGVPLFLQSPGTYKEDVGPDWDAPLDQVTYRGLSSLARNLPQLNAVVPL